MGMWIPATAYDIAHSHAPHDPATMAVMIIMIIIIFFNLIIIKNMCSNMCSRIEWLM